MKTKFLKRQAERLINRINELKTSDLNEKQMKTRLTRRINRLEEIELKIQENNDGTITESDINDIKSCITSAKEKLN
jgi:uncharacterized protein (UPF0305 family)